MELSVLEIISTVSTKALEGCEHTGAPEAALGRHAGCDLGYHWHFCSPANAIKSEGHGQGAGEVQDALPSPSW